MRTTVDRRHVIEVLARARLAVGDSNSISELLMDYHRDPALPQSELPEALMDCYDGVSNGYLSDLYEALTGRRVEVLGKPAQLMPCRCCSRNTLHESFDVTRGTGYDICSFCGWEDDGTSDKGTPSSANSGTLAEYRARLEGEPNFYYRDKWFRRAGSV